MRWNLKMFLWKYVWNLKIFLREYVRNLKMFSYERPHLLCVLCVMPGYTRCRIRRFEFGGKEYR